LSTIYKAKIIPFFYLLQLFFSNLLSRTQVNKKILIRSLHLFLSQMNEAGLIYPAPFLIQ